MYLHYEATDPLRFKLKAWRASTNRGVTRHRPFEQRSLRHVVYAQFADGDGEICVTRDEVNDPAL